MVIMYNGYSVLKCGMK